MRKFYYINPRIKNKISREKASPLISFAKIFKFLECNPFSPTTLSASLRQLKLQTLDPDE